MEKRAITLILGLFVAIGLSYALITPAFEASDELWHYPMIRHLADGNPLPVQVFDPALAGPWKQEASQPPLYYYVGAALTFWIDTSDMEQVRWLNPHVDNGVITEDGNINLAIHDPDASNWQGTLLAIRIVRIVSVLMGAVTVYLTYLIGKEVMPSRPEIALGAAAINAFTPMFLFISGAVNNDNLAIPLASWAILLMIRLVKGTQRDAEEQRYTEIKRLVGLGCVIGLGVLTKEGTIGLLPLAWGTVFIWRWRLIGDRGLGIGEQLSRNTPHATRNTFRTLGQSLMYFIPIILPVLLISGWWYWRNVELYGDWLGWSAFLAVLGERPQPATLAQLWDERWGFMASYWGLFGGVNVPLWEGTYRILNGVLIVGVIGFVIYAIKEVRLWSLQLKATLDSVISTLLNLVVRYFPLVVCLLFSMAVVYGLIDWARVTWSSQGRLVFTAMSTLNVLLVVGLVGWMPRDPAKVILLVLGGFMLCVSALAPLMHIRPAYQLSEESYPLKSKEVEAVFNERLALDLYYVSDSVTRPGATLDIYLTFNVLQEMNQNWSVFVHLNDPVLDTPQAQRDMYLGQGLLATTLLRPGQQITNHYHINLPDTLIAPSKLDLVVGLYNFETEERMKLADGSDALVLTTIDIEPRPGTTPNATSLNFGDEIEIVGYTVEPRQARPGEPVTLTIYWQPLHDLTTNYTFFSQLLDQDTTRWASADIAPDGGTVSYPAGQTQTLTLPMVVDENAPAGAFPLIVGLYTQTEDGSFQRLQLVESGRITMNDTQTLTQIRIINGK